METGTLLSIVSLITVIPLGIASNMLTPRLLSFLEKRKLIKTHRTREQAILAYRRIKAFHEGRADRYPFYILYACGSIIAAITAATLVIVGIMTDKVMFFPSLSLLALPCSLITFAFLLVIYLISRQLENFAAFKTEIEKRWGPIDEETPTL